MDRMCFANIFRTVTWTWWWLKCDIMMWDLRFIQWWRWHCLSSLSSSTTTICTFLRVRDQVKHPYKKLMLTVCHIIWDVNRNSGMIWMNYLRSCLEKVRKTRGTHINVACSLAETHTTVLLCSLLMDASGTGFCHMNYIFVWEWSLKCQCQLDRDSVCDIPYIDHAKYVKFDCCLTAEHIHCALNNSGSLHNVSSCL